MTDTFDDLDIAPVLVAGTEALGWDAPSGLQRDAMAVLRRGNNVVLHASAGSGAVGAYGLAILDRLIGADADGGAHEDDSQDVDPDAPSAGAGPRALVLAPDDHSAAAIAHSLARLAVTTGLVVRARGTGWLADDADVLVVPATTALAAVRSSALKLGSIMALVIDSADIMAGGDQWPAVETLVDSVPGPAQRVLVTGSLSPEIRNFIERHVRRAMTVPAQGEAGSAGGSIQYTVVSEADKVSAAVQLLGGMDHDQVAVVCRTADRADTVAADLAARGLPVDGHPAEDQPQVLVLPRGEADQRSIQAGVLSYDVPFDADELDALHSAGGAVLVTPRERAHLQQIAQRLGLRLEPVAVPHTASTAADRLRDRLRHLAGEDLTPELALLEPLMDELPAAEIAAAAIRLARASTGDSSGPRGDVRETARGSSSAAPPPDAGTWVHLFLSVGERDDIGPGDIVGAITGETGVSGDRVGKIDIRESHSTVEVATDIAPRVIDALNGRTLGGRSMRVDYDRKDRGAARGSGRQERSGGRSGRK